MLHDLTWRLLTKLKHWQDLAAGLLALAGAFIAAYVGARAAYRVGRLQAEEARKRMLVQAKAIAVGIYPAILLVRRDHQRANAMVAQTEDLNGFDAIFARGADAFEMIRQLKIAIPPILDRFLDQLFLLEDCGAAIIQLVGVVGTYNHLLDEMEQRTRASPGRHLDLNLAGSLGGYLRTVETNLNEVDAKLARYHDAPTERA